MITIHHIDTIISDPQIRGGQPVIADTHVRVSDLVASHIYRGLSPEELAVNFSLDMGQVYAALAYYYQHKSQLDDLMRQEARAAETLLAEFAINGKLLCSASF
ncbi:MAG: DUF433 domain-containing protein [Anaerolineae bacterium]|nr:DUF433 domain-containing protein [Anaerolineae bacterium]